MALPYSTGFVAPDGTLVTAFGPFVEIWGAIQIWSDAASNAGSTHTDSCAVDDVFGDDQFARGIVSASAVGSYAGLSVRNQGDPMNPSFYSWIFSAVDSYLLKIISGVLSVLAVGDGCAGSDEVYLQAQGNVLTVLKNGVAPGIAPFVDSDLLTGSGGLAGFSNPANFATGLSFFETGNLIVGVPGSAFMPAFLPGV